MQQDVEAIRVKFRPHQIKTLFVGESAPVSGDFFYHGNSNMLRYMKEVVESVFGKSDDFLDTFKSYGWYLDDLVLTPVNGLGRPERKAKCRDAQSGLAARIAEYQPKAIVSLLSSIRETVEAAASDAGSIATRYSVPFPGNGQQARFRVKMTEILPKLPRL